MTGLGQEGYLTSGERFQNLLGHVLRTCKIATICASAFSCALPTPLYDATREIGNTYVLDNARRVHVCAEVMKNCFTRSTGSFTIDNSGRMVGRQTAIMRLVFDDGVSGWTEYDDFASQKFIQPAETDRAVKLGMSSSQIKENWGSPDAIIPITVSGVALQKWTYTTGDELYFENDKVSEIALKTSLLPRK